MAKLGCMATTYVIDVVKDIFPKHIQHLRADQEAADAHPQPVRERGQSESDDEVGEERGHEHHEGFAGQEVEEEPHDPGEEAAGGGAEVVEPVGDDREDEGDENYSLELVAERRKRRRELGRNTEIWNPN